jgi:AcrR family transcriptional regulator
MPRDGRVVRQRLERAALELFTEHGYDQTTTAQIAARAGVTERTYFRHFADKREVLFASEEELREVTRQALANLPEDLEPLPALQRGFHGVVPLIERNRPLAERRARIIWAAPALREREQAKAAALVDLVAHALEDRGVSERTALLCARVGMDTFSTAIRRWSTEQADLDTLVDETFNELRALTAPVTR